MIKRILKDDRIRQPGKRFSFIPHRFLLNGFFKSLNPSELLLYFFLTLASDKNGISYYGQKSICAQIHLGKKDYTEALSGLIEKDLVSFDGIFFQVLELPEAPVLISSVDRNLIDNLCMRIGNGGRNAKKTNCF